MAHKLKIKIGAKKKIKITLAHIGGYNSWYSEVMSDLQAAKRGFRKVRPSLWISLTPSFLSVAWLLSDRCFCSRHCRTVGAVKQMKGHSFYLLLNCYYKYKHIISPEISG